MIRLKVMIIRLIIMIEKIVMKRILIVIMMIIIIMMTIIVMMIIMIMTSTATAEENSFPSIYSPYCICISNVPLFPIVI